MKHAIRFSALAVIALVTYVFGTADDSTLKAFGCCFLITISGSAFALCVLAGDLTKRQRDEANGLNHPDGLEGKN